MPSKSFIVSVEPTVLIWARESIGMNIGDVAKRLKGLKVSKDTISKWESGQKNPTLIQLEKLAKSIYKRPLAAFFLPEPPEELPLPEDFRTLPWDERKPFSPETRLAIRRARRLQSLTAELAKSLNRKITTKINKVNLSDNPEVVASRIREQLGVGIQTQFSWKNETEALNEWKKAVEKRGVFVFQIGMPLEETRGFSLTEGKILIIVLNLRDSINGRIFSLFHEYGHLLLNDSGICDMGDQDYLSDEAKSIEKFCNHFAGAVLVPKDALLNHNLIKSKEYSAHWSDEILKELAKSFKVSQEVILRRLVILRLSRGDFYKRKREEWKVTEYRRKGGPPRNLPKECVQKNGVPFVSLVLESHREEKITYSDVADYLTIQLKHLPKVEQLIGGRV
ncbi:MAG: zinc peptidase [Armatimonadetes bacterium CG07_land_8_20_14_0_80_40_9]|nr:MAG: zinc peptidase [Armatimonadetes bacterium CG07_land_8_20_14_0_80_40_9]